MSLNLQASNNIATSPKCPSSKKKDAIKLSEWAANQIEKQYQSKVTDESIKALEGLLGQLQLEIQIYKFIYMYMFISTVTYVNVYVTSYISIYIYIYIEIFIYIHTHIYIYCSI